MVHPRSGGRALRPLYANGFEDPETGGPEGSGVFNGGCKDRIQTADRCTGGWNYVARGVLNEADHAYFLEMRDRSGFDAEGRGQSDRPTTGNPVGGIEFEPGLSLVYADEAHGYGNNGVDNPPAQSPLDSVPQPGEDAPELKDAAFTAAAARSTFSDTRPARRPAAASTTTTTRAGRRTTRPRRRRRGSPTSPAWASRSRA